MASPCKFILCCSPDFGGNDCLGHVLNANGLRRVHYEVGTDACILSRPDVALYLESSVDASVSRSSCNIVCVLTRACEGKECQVCCIICVFRQSLP